MSHIHKLHVKFTKSLLFKQASSKCNNINALLGEASLAKSVQKCARVVHKADSLRVRVFQVFIRIH
jgi:hypothetical protein